MSLALHQKLAELCAVFGRSDEMNMPVPSAVWRRIEDYHKIYCGVPGRLSDTERERFMLNTFLNLESLRIKPEHIDTVFNGEDNVFEIYDFNLAQLYRSASFLRFRTYPLVTLMTKSNFELYAREAEYLPAISAQVEDFKKTLEPFHFNVPTHKVWEQFGERNMSHHWRMKLNFCAPVFNAQSGEATGFLVTHHTEQVFRSPFVGADLRLVPDLPG